MQCRDPRERFGSANFIQVGFIILPLNPGYHVIRLRYASPILQITHVGTIDRRG